MFWNEVKMGRIGAQEEEMRVMDRDGSMLAEGNTVRHG